MSTPSLEVREVELDLPLHVVVAVVEGEDNLLVVLLLADKFVRILPELYRTTESVLVATVVRLPLRLRVACEVIGLLLGPARDLALAAPSWLQSLP